MDKLLCLAIFLRHGQTLYTNVFPDLTDEGVDTITKSARLIKEKIEGCSNVSILSSPKPRALGSATVIKNILGNDSEIVVCHEISELGIRDQELGMAIVMEYITKGGQPALDLSYTCDERYEDGKVFESRSFVRKRFLSYLAGLVRKALEMRKPECLVCVSHFEVLHHFVEVLFHLDYAKDATLANGEPIFVSMYESDTSDVVSLDVEFRGKTVKGVAFNYQKESF